MPCCYLPWSALNVDNKINKNIGPNHCSVPRRVDSAVAAAATAFQCLNAQSSNFIGQWSIVIRLNKIGHKKWVFASLTGATFTIQ